MLFKNLNLSFVEHAPAFSPAAYVAFAFPSAAAGAAFELSHDAFIRSKSASSFAQEPNSQSKGA